MSLTLLKNIIPPPATPSEVGTLSQWRDFENSLGIQLPADYRDFIFTYGSGLFAGFYLVYNPFSTSQYISLLPSITRVCSINRESKKEFPDRFPYSYYPETNGLLPWGNDENGNDYFWLTKGKPDEWQVVQDENRGKGIQTHPFTFTQFLVSILKKETPPLASGYNRRRLRV
ncbi:MAG: SMI1/KNR4 family protein [Zavarzinella sp.]